MKARDILYIHNTTKERFIRMIWDKYDRAKNTTIILLSQDENDGTHDIFIKYEDIQKELKNFTKIGRRRVRYFENEKIKEA